jgi:glycosyltransferase involved in cell wall biosynthesis
MKIDIYTFTLGRKFYLDKLISSIEDNLTYGTYTIDHTIVFQGCDPFPVNTCTKFYDKNIGYYSNYNQRFVHWNENIGIAEGMNRILPTLNGDIIIKMDDDCKIISNSFFDHIIDIHKLKPNSVFSPFPVGLINNRGGPAPISHEVVYNSNKNVYYTFRKVNHIGGFCRISPNFTKEWKFSPDLIPGISGNEDGQHSNKCNQFGIEMFYLDNALIVEHQESTLGQHARYGEAYFKGRT